MSAMANSPTKLNKNSKVLAKRVPSSGDDDNSVDENEEEEEGEEEEKESEDPFATVKESADDPFKDCQAIINDSDDEEEDDSEESEGEDTDEVNDKKSGSDYHNRFKSTGKTKVMQNVSRTTM